MGATWLVYLKNQRGMSDIQDRLVSMGAKPSGKYNVSCRLYKDAPAVKAAAAATGGVAMTAAPTPVSTPSPAGAAAKPLYVITHSKEVTKQYSLVGETFTEGDLNLETLVVKLRVLYQLRQTLNIEGWEYTYGDFAIRTGSIQVGSTTKGVVLEVEYRPCSHPKNNDIAKEFLQFCAPPPLLSQMDPAELPDFQLASLDFPFTTAHTAFQYLSLFKKEDLL